MRLHKSNLLEGLQRQKSLFEETFAQLHTNSKDPRKGSSKNIVVRYTGIYQDQKTKQAVTTWTADSASGKGKYNVEVGISLPQGSLFTFAATKTKLGDKVKTLASADVRVYCSCPYFYWWGPKFNTGPHGNLSKDSGIHKSNGYKYEKDIVSYAPNVRDPERTHLLCKHLDSVFKHFSANALDIMRDAKATNVITPVQPEESAEKEPVGLDKSKPDQEKLRKGLMENFSNKVDELYKNKELSDEESKEVVDTVMPSGEEDTEKQETAEPINQPAQLKERQVEDVKGILNSSVSEEPESEEETEIIPEENINKNQQNQKILQKDRDKTINPQDIIT